MKDRILVHLHFHNGVGISDEYATKELSCADILSLPPPPDLPTDDDADCCSDSYWREELQVSALGKTVEFQFREFQENVSSRIQVLHGGPYLVTDKRDYPCQPHRT